MVSWREKNRYNRILQDAEAGKYSVLAVIAYNIEQIVGFMRATERSRSPLIIQFFPWAIAATDGLLVD